jgi:putative oligomerization/nucleic acid binding protein
MPLIGRRRPLLRAAMVGGTAYAAGKHVQRNQQHEYEQDQMIAESQQEPQQYAPAPAAAPPPPPPMAPAPPAPAAPQSAADRIAALTQLKSLLDAGVLTQDEFDAQKQQILQEG